MAIFTPTERRFVQAISDLSYSNPFLPGRIELERAALGREFSEAAPDWNNRPDRPGPEHANIAALRRRAEELLERARQRLAERRTPAGEGEAELYEDLAVFVLYHRFREGFDRTILAADAAPPRGGRIGLYEQFEEEAGRYLEIPGLVRTAWPDTAHIFAITFQVRRAFHHIFGGIIGSSGPSVKLRAAVWQSIFTHDMRRYRRMLHARMADFSTLITGPTGTGKEIVARAVGLSRYIPFDADSRRFAEDFAGTFFPLNLSALSPTLIESELFGHKRGAFTGAVADRTGWLELCPPLGTVFLDEIGELEPAIQVKLLRVIQARRFQRLGDTADREFRGKIIAATHRDLAARMHAGEFRHDLYYRLCSDILTTPSLREQLADRPEDLADLVRFLARRMVGEEAEPLARDVLGWIEANLGMGYAWPGNIRELEQCVRNLLIRGGYQPARPPTPGDETLRLTQEIRGGTLTAEELLRRYCRIVYEICGSYEAAAKRLGLDRRTVKAKVHG